MEVYSIDLTLILLLPHVVLNHMTTHSSEFMDSSIMNLLHTNTPVCDSKTSTQRFKSSTEMSSDGSNFYNTRRRNMHSSRRWLCVVVYDWLWISKVVVVTVGGWERERDKSGHDKPNFGYLEANLVLGL